MSAWPFKEPGEVLDYGYNWTTRGLGTDTIASTTLSPQDWPDTALVIISHGVGPVQGALTNQGTVTWLEGGTLGNRYTMLIQIITAGGRTFEDMVSILIQDR